MGKPRALKSGSVSKGVRATVGQATRLRFNDDEDKDNDNDNVNDNDNDNDDGKFEELAEEVKVETKRKGRSKESVEAPNDEAGDSLPEIVSSHSSEVQRLRELHDRIVAPAKKKASRSKKRAEKRFLTKHAEIDAEKTLDISVLNALSGVITENASSDDDEDIDSRKRKKKVTKIDSSKRSRMM
jgi:hypothetical protein